MGIKMDPGPVSATGESMHDIANTAHQRTKSLLDSSDAAASANVGWTSGGALGACKTAWRDRFNKLIDQTTEIGDTLKASAGSVSAMDQKAADRLNHVMHDMAGT